MNNKIILSFIIFCCSNTLINMELHRLHPNQSQTWYLYKEINVAEKTVGTSQKDILRKCEEYYITSICIDPSETSLGIASCDQKVHIMDIQSEEIIMSLDCKSDIASICFDRSGREFAITSYNSTTHILNIKRNEHKKIIPNLSYSVFDYNKEISSIFFDNSNNALGVILDRSDSTMNIINIPQNKKVFSFDYHEYIKLGSVSPSKKYFITTSGTKQARLFNLTTGQPTCVFTLRGPASAFAFDNRENLLAIASTEPKAHTNEHKVRIFDLKTFQEIATFGNKKYISTVAFSSSGKTLAFGSFDGKVYLFKRR